MCDHADHASRDCQLSNIIDINSLESSIDVVVTDNCTFERPFHFLLTKCADGSCIYELREGNALVNSQCESNVGPSSNDTEHLEIDNDMSETDVEPPSPQISNESRKRTRKRQRIESEWKQRKRVTDRNSGKSYFTAKNKLVPEKTFCPGICGKEKCGSVSLGVRKTMFKSFWEIGSYNLQNAHLCSLVDETPVARHTVTTEPPGRKKHRKKDLVRHYHLPTSAGRQLVCKICFLSTFSISNGRLDRALKNRRENQGIVKTDRRGKHTKHSLPLHIKKSVTDHIGMFPRYVSHYTRAHQASREFLDPNLNIKSMYKLYVKYCRSKSFVPASESFYRQTFNTKFNLSFHQPLKDTCRKCDKFKVDPSPATEIQKELHLRKAEKVRKKLNNAKENPCDSDISISFDLQKTLLTPYISTGEAYYKRQLATYNLGIHDLTNNEASMYMWHEGCASRGASEIGSCIFKYINEKVARGKTSVTAFCDSCGGQNRNYKMAALMSHCVSALPLQSFTINYMQSGHSFLPNDADFGVIEKAKKKGKDIYVPEHWMELIKNARSRPFNVVEMAPTDFYDLECTAKQLTFRKKLSDGSPVKWLDIQCISFTKEHPRVMKFKYVCEEEVEWFELDLRKGRSDKSRKNITTSLVAGPPNRPIKKTKYEDLQSLKQYIPPIFHAFYDSLPVESTDNDAPDLLEDDVLDLSEDELI